MIDPDENPAAPPQACGMAFPHGGAACGTAPDVPGSGPSHAGPDGETPEGMPTRKAPGKTPEVFSRAGLPGAPGETPTAAPRPATPAPDGRMAGPPPHPRAGILVRDVAKGYGEGLVLDGLSFELPAGETLAVVGPSGCGKSTLLYLLAGLDKADRGTVSTGGRDGKTGNISFILQDYGLFPWKTVAENLSLPLELRGEGRTRRREAVAAMLDELGLTGLGPRYPVQLSGGQRQRVAIGRALITDPDILLMDEPFSSLDALTREHLQRTVLSLWRRRRPTCVLVTHNVPEAVFLGRRVMVLSGRPARKTLWLDNPRFGEEGAAFEETRRVYEALSETKDCL